MTAVYILKEHPEVEHKLENVIYFTIDSTFVWMYQGNMYKAKIGVVGGYNTIRVKLARILYLKVGEMTIIGERS